jgi:hypothetical protein
MFDSKSIAILVKELVFRCSVPKMDMREMDDSSEMSDRPSKVILSSYFSSNTSRKEIQVTN